MKFSFKFTNTNGDTTTTVREIKKRTAVTAAILLTSIAIGAIVGLSIKASNQ